MIRRSSRKGDRNIRKSLSCPGQDDDAAAEATKQPYLARQRSVYNANGSGIRSNSATNPKKFNIPRLDLPEGDGGSGMCNKVDADEYSFDHTRGSSYPSLQNAVVVDQRSHYGSSSRSSIASNGLPDRRASVNPAFPVSSVSGLAQTPSGSGQLIPSNVGSGLNRSSTARKNSEYLDRSMLGIGPGQQTSKSCPASRQSSGEHLALDIGYNGIDERRLSATSARSYKRLSASSPGTGSRQFLDPSYTPDPTSPDPHNAGHNRRLSDSAAVRNSQIRRQQAQLGADGGGFLAVGDHHQRRHSEQPPARFTQSSSNPSSSSAFAGERGFDLRLSQQQSRSCGDDFDSFLTLDPPVGSYYSPPSARRLSMHPGADDRRYADRDLRMGLASAPNSRRPSNTSYCRPAHYYESPPRTSPRGSVVSHLSSHHSSHHSSRHSSHHSSAGSFSGGGPAAAQPCKDVPIVTGGGRLLPTSVSATPLGGKDPRLQRENSSPIGKKNDQIGGKKPSGHREPYWYLERSGGAGAFDKSRSAVTRGSSVSWDYTLHQYAAGVHLSPFASPYHTPPNNSRHSSVGSTGCRQQAGSVAGDRDPLFDPDSKTRGSGTLHRPLYGSIAYQLKDASGEASGTIDFVCKALLIIHKTVFFTCVLICFLTLPVVMVVMGVQYMEECPVEPNVPIYLLVGGIMSFIHLFCILWRQVRSRRLHTGENEEFNASSAEEGFGLPRGTTQVVNWVLWLFLAAWFAAGNCWTFRVYPPSYKQNLWEPDNWCSQTVYVFTLVSIGIVYTALSVVLLAACGIAVYQKFFDFYILHGATV